MISQADRKATDMALRTREPRATTKAIQRETRTKMTKQEWEASQRRNLQILELRMKFPPDNYQTITKSY